MMERKAKAIFEEYKSAELSGDDNRAEELEKRLNDGGWRVTHGPDGWVVVRKPNEQLNEGNALTYLPRNTPVRPYNRNSSELGTGFYTLIGLGAIALIIGLIVATRAIKRNRNAGFNKLQTRY